MHNLSQHLVSEIEQAIHTRISVKKTKELTLEELAEYLSKLLGEN